MISKLWTSSCRVATYQGSLPKDPRLKYFFPKQIHQVDICKAMITKLNDVYITWDSLTP